MDEFRVLADKLLDLADRADEIGMEEQADRVAGVVGKIGLLKLAQYEGFQHYWIMNGRAFEKAWRHKRKLKKTDDSKYHWGDPDYYKSAHECWWDTLEEYQDYLMGNHRKGLEAHASKKDEETEESGMGGGSSQTMSKEMTEFHKKIKEEGKSEGEAWVKWLDEQSKKAAGLVLLEKIADKVEDGESPGVAFYEATEELSRGGYVEDICSEIEDISKTVASKGDDRSTKLAAGVMDSLGDLLERGVGQLGEFFRRKMGTGDKELEALDAATKGFDDVLDQLGEDDDLTPQQWMTYLNPVLDAMGAFYSKFAPQAFDESSITSLIVADQTGTVPIDNMHKVVSVLHKLSVQAPHLLEQSIKYKSPEDKAMESRRRMRSRKQRSDDDELTLQPIPPAQPAQPKTLPL